MKPASLSILCAAAVSLAACAASTKFSSTWKAPDVQGVSFQGQKVAALVFSSEESTRLGAEGELARELTRRGVNGIPAYNLLPPNQTKGMDKEKAKALFTAAGIQGVVVMRALGAEKEISSSAGGVYSPYGAPYYGSFWGGGGYWGYGWGAVYDPGYLRTDTIVNVETLVYDLKADKLIWAGKSQTTNPERVDTMIKELVASAAAEMKKQGLIKKQ
jgi:hypothetical protein